MSGIFTPQDDASDSADYRKAKRDEISARNAASRAAFQKSAAELAEVGDSAVEKLWNIFHKKAGEK